MWEGLRHLLGPYSQLCELSFGCMKMCTVGKCIAKWGWWGSCSLCERHTREHSSEWHRQPPTWVTLSAFSWWVACPAIEELPLVYLHWAGPWVFLKQCFFCVSHSLLFPLKGLVVAGSSCLLSFKASNCFQLLAIEDSDFLEVNPLGAWFPHSKFYNKYLLVLFWMIMLFFWLLLQFCLLFVENLSLKVILSVIS